MEMGWKKIDFNQNVRLPQFTLEVSNIILTYYLARLLNFSQASLPFNRLLSWQNGCMMYILLQPLLINRTAYRYHINGSDYSPEHRPLPSRRLNSNGITVVNKETEVISARQFEALKQQRRLGARGSIDSGGSGVSSPMSWSDTAGENSTMQQVMA